jgi:Hemerythrin HHE cation binding domain
MTSTESSQPTFSIYGPIHKGLRHAISTILVRIGTTSFADDAAVTSVLDDLDVVLHLNAQHLVHEDTFIRPLLEARGASILGSIDAAHEDHAKALNDLRTLAASVRENSGTKRVALGRVLYLQVAIFAADNLLHMGEEEQVVEPLLFRAYTEAELLEAHGRLVASIPPDEMLISLRFMVAGSSPEERVALLGNAPPPARAALLDAVRPVLAQRDFEELASRLAA